ncbi:TPA: type 2 isopentenyl-diphosphate Delta-isomerase [archaeon]|uniref:Isopentenyl-diphosphate delta-isomerase n=1 Tax=Candidatus Naiadarchaeum limnaeum TaxID=2756139 RepID=A0A832VB75_9ARCH|nr:type 2 isopentenyl-diphosphate Delta-isomerase [Candidatus Naiadarchaeales archaeon SRR2090153.bin1042]HIK00961.1 type 2 isopentenyl-diphosphate Delta-isomerase [Candidatus Naiadarchaeum limnaeum]
MTPGTSDRKLEHIRIVSKKNVQAKQKTNWLEYVDLVHNSIPELNKNDIDLSINFLGHKLDYPILISGMTGGHAVAQKINETLAKAAEKTNVAMGVGSQRAMLENPELAYTYQVRKFARSIFLIGNLGIPQLEKYGTNGVKKAANAIGADAFAVHLNNLQEVVQREGDVNAKNYFKYLKKICSAVKIPVIAKETGAGISREAAKLLIKAGVKAIDVGGAGGTSWSAVEILRGRANKSSSIAFWDWGIPTAASILEIRSVSEKIHLIASGGLRNGLEAAKCIALGADLVGMAYPFFKAAEKGTPDVVKTIEEIGDGLRNAMFLVGAKNLKELKKANFVINNNLLDWALWRGLRK